jgi:hypothetical protein
MAKPYASSLMCAYIKTKMPKFRVSHETNTVLSKYGTKTRYF